MSDSVLGSRGLCYEWPAAVERPATMEADSLVGNVLAVSGLCQVLSPEELSVANAVASAQLNPMPAK